MKSPPVTRPQVFDIYWKFAAARQAIFDARVKGQLPPWTTDAVLLKYKFCNVYRASDRVSQYLIRKAACNTEIKNLDDQIFQIVAFRMFSRINTWKAIRGFLGNYPTIRDLKSGDFLKAVESALQRNGGLYTGAFILCANAAYGFDRKHLNHVGLFQEMFLKRDFASRIRKVKSLAEIFEELRGFPLLGDFMAYQIAIDLNYSDQFSFSENDFTKPGPGALRGIQKVFESLGDFSPAEVIKWMVDRQEIEFARLGLKFSGLWGRPLHAIDCQGLFCEVDKYCREAVPELTSARKRIKAKFTPSGDALLFFFPPKWKINHLLPNEPVLGSSDDKSCFR